MMTTRWIVGVDLTEFSRLALARALSDAMAAKGERSTEVHAVLALDDRARAGGSEVQTAWEVALREGRAALEPFVRSVQEETGAHGVPCFVHVDFGNPSEAILSVADEVAATQIFVGTHGRRGLQRAFIGSVSESVVRRAHCPVLVVRPLELVEPVPTPEPASASSQEREPLETHVYRYSSLLEVPGAPGHLA